MRHATAYFVAGLFVMFGCASSKAPKTGFIRTGRYEPVQDDFVVFLKTGMLDGKSVHGI